jgi:hypothetical protein
MQSEQRDRMFRRPLPLHVVLALAVIASPAPAQQAAPAGKVLDAVAVKALVSDRVWTTEAGSSGSVRYWAWKSDGSICYRIFQKDGKCDDTGQWKLDGNRLCYQLSWAMKSQELNSMCFPIVDLGKGHYAALEDNGLHLFDFTVSK